MFRGDIEQKIVEFIKKSPIGVTSTEIAKYLDVNRITLAKYLSVIKEKALIDFKQLGMAKLWYIPVKINDTDFLKTILIDLVSNMDENASKLIRKSGLKFAKNIEELYKHFYDVENLNLDQLAEAIVDAEKKIGGEFKVVDKTSDRIVLRNTKCPFGPEVRKCPGLCSVTSNILGTMAAKSFGYSKVHLRKTIAWGTDHCYIIVHLRKTKESEKEKTTEYFTKD